MICYKCHSNMAKKIINSIIIDQCNTCGAIWLDRGQLQKILYKSKNKSIYQLKKQLYLQKKFKNKIQFYGFCPNCNSLKLNKTTIHNIQIQKCIRCRRVIF